MLERLLVEMNDDSGSVEKVIVEDYFEAMQ
jgi:hypothetical protein